jgi:EAL domain-containing protein (putative c-di-GMP-specific phosphodiesterase class I)
VETQSQFDSLQSMGCDQFQGYLISHPISAQDVRPFLSC